MPTPVPVLVSYWTSSQPGPTLLQGACEPVVLLPADAIAGTAAAVSNPTARRPAIAARLLVVVIVTTFRLSCGTVPHAQEDAWPAEGQARGAIPARGSLPGLTCRQDDTEGATCPDRSSSSPPTGSGTAVSTPNGSAFPGCQISSRRMSHG